MQQFQSYKILVRGSNFQLDAESDERFGFYTRRMALAPDEQAAIEKVMEAIRYEFRLKVHNKSTGDMPVMFVDEVEQVPVASYKSLKDGLGETQWFLEGEDAEKDGGS